MNDQVIAGRYNLQGRLGVGGMSTVQRAFDSRLEREVAVKLLAEHLAEDSAFVSRFRREALAAARLVHPNIVQVFDFGLDEASGQHFIVMELVSGHSCAELLRDHGRLPIDEALEVIGQSCRGLDHAHRNGVIHRDVKPGNLLRSHDGVVKLADFGIAKAGDNSSITQVGSVLGTAAYLSPEQARGEEAGPPADLYGLGVVTYQLLSGRLPYEASSLSELTLKQQREVPMPLDAINTEVSPPLARAVARALSLDAAARYSDALSMGEALRAAERGIEPPAADVPDRATEATELLEQQGQTEATRLMPPGGGETPVQGLPEVQRRVAQRAARRDEPQEQRPARRRRRPLRTLVMLLVLAALVVAGVVIANDQLGGNPRLRDVTAQDVQQAIEEVKQLIEDNTR